MVWGAPEISSSSECESGSAGSDLRSFDGKAGAAGAIAFWGHGNSVQKATKDPKKV